MNEIALQFIKARERCELTAYQDQGGRWTIGWGATGVGIVRGLIWRQIEADDDLRSRVFKAEVSVVALTAPLRLPAESQAALISFEYNCGLGALATSHLLAFVRARDRLAAAKAFPQWDHVGGVEDPGLLKRRYEEAALFLDGGSLNQ